MAQFVLINQHSAEEHSSLMEEFGQNRDKLPEAFRGEVQYCTCPGGEHGGYWMVEADSAEAALSLLDPFPGLKAGSRAVEGMRFAFGET
jgi:hypothetical protein